MRWLLAIFVILFVSLALQAGLVAYAGYVLLGVFAVSRYLARAWVASLHAECSISTDPREIDDVLEIIVTVRNDGGLFIPWVLVEHALSEHVLILRKLTVNGRRLKVLALRARGEERLKYRVTFHRRGYYQFGPLHLETGDVFGLHRRHRVLTAPAFVLVFPRVLPLARYDFASERPIGEVRLQNRLFDDPTRTAGVRPYQLGDPLQRIHWRATARTGELHSRVYEPTTLAGATILLDFHAAGYPARKEPHRSELAVTLAASIAYAVAAMNQQVGFASNGRDATERIRNEAVSEPEFASRGSARESYEEKRASKRLKPVIVETRRGYDQFAQIRETLARLELTDGLSFTAMLLEIAPRLPRDATLVVLLPQVDIETSVALGHLRRRGFAITAILVGMADDGSDARVVAHGRLLAERIRDVRFVNTEADIRALGSRAATLIPTDYAVAAKLD